MRGALLFLACLWFFVLCGSGAAEFLSQKGKIGRENFVNLRSGPDLRYPSKAVLKKGEEVSVKGEKGSWYLVVSADGQKGYVHKTLVVLLGEEQPQASAKNELQKITLSAAERGVENPGAEGNRPSPPTPPNPASGKAVKAKPMPIAKLLEGREWEMLPWLGAALCVFIIGWICGGNYYLRRDRVRRTRLHF